MRQKRFTNVTSGEITPKSCRTLGKQLGAEEGRCIPNSQGKNAFAKSNPAHYSHRATPIPPFQVSKKLTKGRMEKLDGGRLHQLKESQGTQKR